MNPPGPDADVRPRRPAHWAAVALTVTALTTAGCAAVSSAGQALTTTTVATASSSIAASFGPGVQPSFETGVPDAVISFTDGVPSRSNTDGVPPVTSTDGVPSRSNTDGLPDEVRRGPDGDLLVITWGSTTCPRMPVVVSAVDLITIDVVTGSVRVDPARTAEYVSETAVCTADLGPTASTIRIPDGAAGSGALTVIVDGVPHQVE